LIEPIADWDMEVGDPSIVEDEALRWLIEGPLIVEDMLLKAMELILIGFGGNGGVSLAIGDGL
jgi:hypothetical protein